MSDVIKGLDIRFNLWAIDVSLLQIMMGSIVHDWMGPHLPREARIRAGDMLQIDLIPENLQRMLDATPDKMYAHVDPRWAKEGLATIITSPDDVGNKVAEVWLICGDHASSKVFTKAALLVRYLIDEEGQVVGNETPE